jgi:signal transduction histidine kinase
MTIIANNQQVIESGKTHIFEECVVGAQGTRLFQSTKSPLLDADGHIVGIVGVSRDFTEFKQLENELKCFNSRLQEMVESKTSQLMISLENLTRSERFKQSVIDSLPANIAVINQKGNITAVNKPWVQFGLNNGLSDTVSISKGINYLDACINACTYELSSSTIADTALQGITSVLAGHETTFVMDYPCNSPDNKRWFKMTVMRPEAEFEGAVISHVDITVLKQLEEEQRSYTSHLIAAIEAERFRTARELHDDIGQRLTLFSFAIKQLKKDMSFITFDINALEDMQYDVNQMMGSLRQICTALRPTLMEELGLPAALEWLSKDFSRRSGVLCSTAIETCSCCDSDMECSLSIFRIVQESLNNIIKHSSATKADISLKKIEDNVHVEIKDNGRGITTKNRSSGRTLGLIGMRERALSIGATFEITGIKGKGTCVKLVIPCRCKEETDEISHS